MTKKIVLPVFACLLFLSATSGVSRDSLTVADANARSLESLIVANQNIISVPEDYPKIQDAINAANPDDIIQVKAATYYEQLFVQKPLTIMGEDKNTTTIIGRVNVLSNNVVIKGFTVRNAPSLFCGITIYSNCNVVSENIIKNNGEDGIWLYYNTRNNTIITNIIERNTFCGITLENSTDNVISENFIVNNEHGMMISYSENNTIVGNTLLDNSHCGVHLRSSNNNIIYHNNFFNSPLHSSGSINTWDNGAEGNYWSDYEGNDVDGDGVGDTFIPHLGLDYYPLVERWSILRMHSAFVWNEKTYHVITHSNCTVASFTFNHSAKQINFKITGPPDKTGFCNVTVPKLLLVGNPWQVLINGIAVDVTEVGNKTHSSLYFPFKLSTRSVKIVGTEALDTVPPMADAGPDQVVNKTALVTFDGSNSIDNAGITSYTWAFNDDGAKTLTGMNPTYIFNTPGNYTVTLKVADAVGNYDTDVVRIIVLNVQEAIPWWIMGLAAVASVVFIAAAMLLWKRRKEKSYALTRVTSGKKERRRRKSF